MTTTVTAQDNAPKVLISEAGRKGDPGTNGTDGAGFNQVRKSLIDNPLCHLFKTNKLVEASAPTGTDSDVTWTRSTTATYADRYGVVKNAAIDTPREEKEGFLIESVSTNLALYSDQFDNAVWAKLGGSSVIANSTISPDGTINADTLALPTVNDSLLQNTGVAAASKTFTFSVWLKGFTGNETVWIALTNLIDDSAATPFNLTLEWKRYSITKTFNTTVATVSAQILNLNAILVNCYAWRGQVEERSIYTSSIKTLAATATRTVDSVSVATLNNLPDITGGRWSLVFNIANLPTPETFTHLYDNDNVDLFRGYFATNGVLTIDNGAQSLSLANALTANQIVITFDGTTTRGYLDGVEVASSSSGSIPTEQGTTLFIGQSSAQTLQINGNIKDVVTYDFTLNADEITYLSGL